MEEIEKIIEPVPETIETIFKNIYRIPVFQRPYKWGREEIEEFINDLEEAYYQNKNWFAGTLYIKLKNKINSSLYEYDIIDGQQRLTTVALMLMVIQTNLIQKGVEEKEEIIEDIRNKLYKENRYLIENEGIEKEIIKNAFENACRNPECLYKKIK